MPRGIGYGSRGPAPYKATAKGAGGGSERGVVQSPYKSKDKLAKRKMSRGRGR